MTFDLPSDSAIWVYIIYDQLFGETNTSSQQSFFYLYFSFLLYCTSLVEMTSRPHAPMNTIDVNLVHFIFKLNKKANLNYIQHEFKRK